MSILEKAKEIVHGRSHDAYGHPADDFTRTATIWSQILDVPVTPQQVGLCMIAVKLSREINKHGVDNLVDIAGYAETVQMICDRPAPKGTTYPPVDMRMMVTPPPGGNAPLGG